MKRTKRVLGLALAAVMCVGLLAGCGGNPSSSDTADDASGAETSEKVLNIATIGETTTLSPLYMIADNRPTQKLLYEGLVKYVDGEIQPVLAEDWELSEDGTQLTFYLRQGVTFHDGEPFNAEAAIANIESWHINPSFASLPGVVNYTNIEAVDEYTIRLTYDTPYFAYINDFCWPDVCTMISPKLITQGDFQTVNGYAGTGPYIYDEYVAGQYTTFVRNENYWGEQPYYDKIVAKYIPDNASRVQALQTGEIDLIYGSAELSYEDYNQAIAIDGIEGKFAPSGSTVRNIILNFNGNLSDLSVRQALAYAIDKEAISEGLTYGYEPVADTIVPDGTPYSDICGTIDYTYNVDRANQILDEAGWVMGADGIREKDGVKAGFTLLYSAGDSVRQALSAETANQLGEMGISVEIEGVGWDVAYDMAQSTPLMWGWGAHTPMELYNIYHTDSDGDYARYSPYANETVDQYMDEALACGDLEESYELWKKAQWDGTAGITQDGDVPWVWLVNIDHLYWVRDGLHVAEQKLHPHGHGWSIVNNVDQWSWE